jgi:hypothetical protein
MRTVFSRADVQCLSDAPCRSALSANRLCVDVHTRLICSCSCFLCQASTASFALALPAAARGTSVLIPPESYFASPPLWSSASMCAQLASPPEEWPSACRTLSHHRCIDFTCIQKQRQPGKSAFDSHLENRSVSDSVTCLVTTRKRRRSADNEHAPSLSDGIGSRVL